MAGHGPTTEALLERLGIRHPILQAPMAGTATAALAAAVTNAGGLGGLGLAGLTAQRADALLTAVRRATPGPYGVNVFCHRTPQPDPQRDEAWLTHLRPFFAALDAEPPTALDDRYPTFATAGPDDLLPVLQAHRPAVVSFHFGLPTSDRLQAVQATGATTMATATDVAEAIDLAAAGIDVVIAQGYEAGGHRGIHDPEARDEQMPTSVLVRLLVEAVDRPVVAAGGLMDGRDIAAALAMGAAAAQLGTAFVACPESGADQGYRQGLTRASERGTAMTRAISGRPARGLVNDLMRSERAPGAPAVPPYPLPYDATKRLQALAVAANGGGPVPETFAAHWAGQGAPRSRAVPAAVLVETLVSELAASWA